MNVDALKTLGTKIQTGAVEFAKEQKVKAGALTAKAGEAIANAKKDAAAARANNNNNNNTGSGDVASSDAEGGEATSPINNRTSGVRETLAGVAATLRNPGVNVEEGSIADILLKARAKVFRSDAAAAATAEPYAMGEDIAATGVATSTEFKTMKDSVDDLASEMETTANDKESPKEKVQKNLIVMFSKLKIAQDKFVAMVEAKKKKMAATEVDAAAAASDAAVAEDAGEDADADAATPAGGERAKKLKNLLSTAETLARKAFENAERVAREAAKKTGLFDKNDETTKTADSAEAAAADVTETGEPEDPPKTDEPSNDDATTPAASEESAVVTI